MKQYFILLLISCSFYYEANAQYINLPNPRLDLNLQTGIMFINPNNASFLYESDALIKSRLDFKGQKEFGPSASLGVEIFYPSSEKLFVGFDFNYVNSTAFARYQDFYGSYDLTVQLRYYSYKFIPKIVILESSDFSWIFQLGFGSSVVVESASELIKNNNSIPNPFLLEDYLRNQSRVLFGLVASVKTGLSFNFDRFNINSKIGYEISLNTELDNIRSRISGFILNFGVGYNLIK
ncbi:hypothetical protein QYS48_11285 [Marivirga arenosa]|uniref:Outer membrane protein beta-barrel domain-containing protein n=1 Tax=Marivirga arenosa TaxID=3059076 RepID=A0AA49JE88_9BACT|nr:hypothetical protein [Marivirga sp. ABR2-2]WKK87304.2 hypothetical protein QYS48_11285 [Marivirga sp. ABR2-2]